MTIERPTELHIGERTQVLPVFFPSISSVKTALSPKDYIKILTSLIGINSQYLVSAFDLARIDEPQLVAKAIATARQGGALILMDSGNYESFWKDAQSDWNQTGFHEMLEKYPCDIAFGFDEQKPPSDAAKHTALIVDRWHADQKAAGKCRIIPIIHSYATELPTLCATVANETKVSIIAVPERNLGDGVLARAQTVKAIRNELHKLGRYVTLHLLGTGNPISIAIYTVMGADSFDGLEWCQTVVDHKTALLYHFSHADFFSAQSNWGDCALSFQARTLAHNLTFFGDWMCCLQTALRQGEIRNFCQQKLPEHVFLQLANIAKWEAK